MLRNLGFNKVGTKKKELTDTENAVIGGLAGAGATLVSHPIDTYATAKQTGNWHIIQKKLRKANGAFGKTKVMYQGVIPKVIKNVPATAASFALFNLLSNKLVERKNQ